MSKKILFLSVALIIGASFFTGVKFSLAAADINVSPWDRGNSSTPLISGQQNVMFLSFTITDSNSPVTLTGVEVFSDSIDAGKLTNIKLYSYISEPLSYPLEGSSANLVASASGYDTTITLNTPLTISAGVTKRFVLQADLGAAQGKVRLGVTSLNVQTTNDGTTDDLPLYSNEFSVDLPNALTYSTASDTPSSQTLSPGQTNVKLLKIKFEASGAHSIRLGQLSFRASGGISDFSKYLTNVRLYNESNQQIGNSVSFNYNALDFNGLEVAGTNMAVSLGTPRFVTLVADIPNQVPSSVDSIFITLGPTTTSGDVIAVRNDNPQIIVNASGVATSNKISILSTAEPVIMISEVKVENLSVTSVKISWNTNVLSNTWVFYGETPSVDGAVQVDNQSSATQHSAVLSNLKSDTRYYYAVSSRVENSSAPSVRQTGEFTTEKFVQPSITVISPNGGESWQKGIGQTVRWQTIGIPATTYMTIRLRHVGYDAESPQTTQAPNNGSTTITPDSFYVASGQYKIEIETYIDNVRYIDTSDAPFTITASNQSLEISNLKVSDVTSNSASIKWDTNISAKSYISYGVENTVDGRNFTVKDDNYNTKHDLKLINLKPNTTYYFEALATDQSGVIKALKSQFTTSSANSPIGVIKLGDGTYELNDGDKVKLDNGLIIVPVYFMSGSGSSEFHNVKFDVYLGATKLTTTDFTRVGWDTKTFEANAAFYDNFNVKYTFNVYVDELTTSGSVWTSKITFKSGDSTRLETGETIKKETTKPANQINEINSNANLLINDKMGEILAELQVLRDTVKEQQNQIKYLSSLLKNVNGISAESQAMLNNFITYGVDANTQKLGAGERAAVVNSYKAAFDKLPTTEAELADVIKIANGRWPSITNKDAENKAKAQFQKIYKRAADMNGAYDNAAVTVMAYGLRQKAENRNLNSEVNGIKIFKAIYGHTPKTTEEWNAMQAITYSGTTQKTWSGYNPNGN